MHSATSQKLKSYNLPLVTNALSALDIYIIMSYICSMHFVPSVLSEVLICSCWAWCWMKMTRACSFISNIVVISSYYAAIASFLFLIQCLWILSWRQSSHNLHQPTITIPSIFWTVPPSFEKSIFVSSFQCHSLSLPEYIWLLQKKLSSSHSLNLLLGGPVLGLMEVFGVTIDTCISRGYKKKMNYSAIRQVGFYMAIAYRVLGPYVP